jgi:pimeloyl-ACP methyl ester carboxylesterase
VIPSVAAMAQWVTEQLVNLNVGRAHVVGHSMGSLIALELSHVAPQQVQSLALLGTAVPMPVGQALQDATASAPMQAMHQINAWSHRPSVSAYRSVNPGFNPIASGASLMARMAHRHGAGVLVSDFAACNGYDTGLERAKNVTVPTLVMNGVNDMMTPPKAARNLANAITNARLILLPDCGHALMSEQPDAVLTALRQHLSGA